MDMWIDGSRLPAAQIATQFAIPREEITSFLGRIRIYARGATIIEEGATDRVIYLLRSGTVDVYMKEASGRGRKLNSIKAINVFGEMAMINEAPRSASIYAVTEEVLVYAFDLPSLSQLFENAKWSELLISRFAHDIRQNHTQMAENARTIAEQRAQIEKLITEAVNAETAAKNFSAETARIANSLLLLFKVVQSTAVVGSRGWYYLNAWAKVSRALFAQLLGAGEIKEWDDATRDRLLRQLEQINWQGKEAIYNNLVDDVKGIQRSKTTGELPPQS